MSSSKLKVLHRIQDSGLIAILRAEVAGQVSQVVEACLAGGASIIEITFTVPGAAGLIEELVKRYGSGDIIISEDTYRHISNRIECKQLPPVKVKGKAEELKVYKVIGLINQSLRTSGNEWSGPTNG